MGGTGARQPGKVVQARLVCMAFRWAARRPWPVSVRSSDCAFRSNDGHNNLCVTWSPDGENWQTPAVIYPEIAMASAPSLAVFNNRLYVGFQGADHLIYVSSADFPN